MTEGSDKTVIFIGASHAAAQGCVSLRQNGFDGRIIVIGDEPHLPYHRPPLSKDFLSGGKTLSDILLRPAEAYSKADIEMRLGVKVTMINRRDKTILCNDGAEVSYDKLVLCTGARVRRLPVPGEDLDGVFYLRNADDVIAISEAITQAKRVVIIGGGYIGLETAASLRKQGLDVTVLEAMERILQRVTPPELSEFYRRIHREEGVHIIEGLSASEIIKTDDGLRVKSSDGASFEADMVIIGIGVIPNTELADLAGLSVGNGVEVDGQCRTNDPDIYAAGDVTHHHNPLYDVNLRLESVPNATEQAKIVAAHICGKDVTYNSLPWFWSDQFDLKLQIAGLSAGYDNLVIRGNISQGRSLAVYAFQGDRLLSVDAVNAPRDFMAGKMALMRGKTFDKTLLANPEADLKSAMIDVP